MSVQKIIVTLVSVLALIALPMSAAEDDADSLEKFHADGMGTLSGADTAPQTAAIKGSFIGGHASVTFTLTNDLTFPMMSAFCAFKRGTATITGSDLTTITMSLAGVGCSTSQNTGNTEVTYVVT